MARYGLMIGKHKVVFEFDFELTEDEKQEAYDFVAHDLMRFLCRHDCQEFMQRGKTNGN